MKHPKKRFVSALLAVAMVIICFFSLCSCSMQEPEMLGDPQNIQVKDRLITWDPVENASGYLVLFNNEEYRLEENSFDYRFITVADTYTFSVVALGDNTNYSNSAIVSETVTIEPPVEHGFDDLGFEYTFDYDILGYEINAGKANLTGMIVLPDYFGDWPVKRIAKEMFKAKGAYKVAMPDCFTEVYCNTITTGIQLPAYLESIGMDAFAFILNLEEIEIPDTVHELGKSAFEGCKQLKMVKLSSNLKEIPRSCFENTALSEIILPEGLERIEGYAFATKETKYGRIDSEVSEVVIPASVKVCGSSAFEGRRNLKTVILEGTLEEILQDCFDDTAWLAAQPDGLVYIQDFLYVYKGEMPENTKIEIPAGTRGIVTGALSDQKNLCEVIIPEGIEFWGHSIFSECIGLASVSLPADMKTISSSMFSGCTALKGITLPDQLMYIESTAFFGSGLESITVPASVVSVGTVAFSECEFLKEISFSSGVEILKRGVLECCESLETVFIPASVKEIICRPFWYCDALTHVFYEGSSFSEFEKILKDYDDEMLDELKAAPIYYYSEEKPTEEGLYWHYVDGKPTPWEIE